MNGKGTAELGQLFEDWQSADRKLSICVEDIRDWMSEVNQMGIPHFGETAARLQPLREALEMHFNHEDEMLAKLAELYPSTSPEVCAFKRQTTLDHQSLLSRLDQLRSCLKQVEPRFESWTAAMDEVDAFFEELDQHERSESDRLGMLMPGEVVEDDGLV